MLGDMLDFSTGCLDLVFKTDQGRLRWEKFTSGGATWLDSTHPIEFFDISVDGKAWNASNLDFDRVEVDNGTAGLRQAHFWFRGPGFTVEQQLRVYGDDALIEVWPIITNTGDRPFTIQRVDSLALRLPATAYELLSFSSDWGSEFEPYRQELTGAVILETRAGRSSKGKHPWFALFQREEQVLSGAVAWSGNWVFRFEPQEDAPGGYRLSGGIHDWAFSKTLDLGEAMQAPPVILSLGGSLNDTARQFARAGRAFWYPHNALSDRLPVEWNHWWPYEDIDIHERVFTENAEAAERMGFEVCTLDAGWFGPSAADAPWWQYRGDWQHVNAQRFPGGIRALADQVHGRGMKFGIWCEIEGLGSDARLALEHPEYVALRDGARLGYVCFGNPQVQAWAYQTLEGLITHYQADWIKLDFNLDPGAGCNCTDHGHQAGDGLYAHYMGYYQVLDRLHQNYPEVVLENCSSGGLRIDLGMLRHTHMTFLSDPDWPVHDLQIFWGASSMLAPDRLLHWSFSDWRSPTPPPQQNFDPHDPGLTRKRFDYYARISMLGVYGYSQKLPDLPAWLSVRIAEHNALYKTQVRRFVREGDLYRLTGQPLRSGGGEGWAAFQYSLPDCSEHLLFVFRLPGSVRERSICMQDLQPERIYTLEGLEGETRQQLTGRALMDGNLVFSDLEEEESALLRVY